MGQVILPTGQTIDLEEPGKVSDGYHTFDELYDHRCLLFMAFQALLHHGTVPYSSAWKSLKHADGSEFEGWFIAGCTLQQGAISYHLPIKFWELCKAPERPFAPEWDGHTSADVIQRLKGWLAPYVQQVVDPNSTTAQSNYDQSRFLR